MNPEFIQYQAESVKRACMPPVAKHSQNKTDQPQKAGESL